jgi:hypothetical protein
MICHELPFEVPSLTAPEDNPNTALLSLHKRRTVFPCLFKVVFHYSVCVAWERLQRDRTASLLPAFSVQRITTKSETIMARYATQNFPLSSIFPSPTPSTPVVQSTISRARQSKKLWSLQAYNLTHNPIVSEYNIRLCPRFENYVK